LRILGVSLRTAAAMGAPVFRSCLQSTLKIVNSILTMVGLAMVLYSLDAQGMEFAGERIKAWQ